ncbi:uncharacterized protein [Antedon mediterranea]|uniref:uncharacterized protein n=1 Tax=Antedon mediterranea TaxID=105859 RepID=UPI003AF9355F
MPQSQPEEKAEKSISTKAANEKEEPAKKSTSTKEETEIEELTETSISTKSVSASDVFLGTTFTLEMGFCVGPEHKPFTGDFDGDGNEDLMFHNSKTGSKKIYYASCDGSFNGDRSWRREMNFCYVSGYDLYIGDFNGDGRSDMLCHRPQTGQIWVALVQPGGVFTANPWAYSPSWCKATTDKVYIGDFNADGRDDILCHTQSSGYIAIYYALYTGYFSTSTTYRYTRSMSWCRGTYQRVYTGDFNGDRRVDMLCHDYSNGYIYVAVATVTGGFTSATWSRSMGWCKHSNSKLSIGDFNKDNRDDIMCSDTNGPYWIAFSLYNGSFSSTKSWTRKQNWCTSGNDVLVSDVNGDGGDDLMCHNEADGIKYISINHKA